MSLFLHACLIFKWDLLNGVQTGNHHLQQQLWSRVPDTPVTLWRVPNTPVTLRSQALQNRMNVWSSIEVVIIQQKFKYGWEERPTLRFYQGRKMSIASFKCMLKLWKIVFFIGSRHVIIVQLKLDIIRTCQEQFQKERCQFQSFSDAAVTLNFHQC